MSEFDEGLDIGESLGWYKAYEQAQNAFDMGEIELWLDYHRPKTFSDWIAWEGEHGSHDELTKRWSRDAD